MKDFNCRSCMPRGKRCILLVAFFFPVDYTCASRTGLDHSMLRGADVAIHDSERQNPMRSRPPKLCKAPAVLLANLCLHCSSEQEVCFLRAAEVLKYWFRWRMPRDLCGLVTITSRFPASAEEHGIGQNLTDV